jgi:PAS domain-containing protein
LAAGEWLRRPDPVWTAGLAAGAIAAVLGLWRQPGWRRVLPALALVAASLVPMLADRRLAALEENWDAVRETQVQRAGLRLEGDLHTAYELAGRLAEAAASGAAGSQEEAFAALARAVPRGGLESGLAILDSSGNPWAWAGRHRLAPTGLGHPVATVQNPFYLALEVSREAGMGRRAVGTVLVWADSIVPDRTRSVTEDFRARSGVGLRVYPAGSAPEGADLFEYSEPTTEGDRLLFSVEPVPPDLSTATASVLRASARLLACLVVIALFLALVLAESLAARLGLMVLALVLLVRTPIGSLLGPEHLFSSATYFRPLLGVASRSAGILAGFALVATVLAVALWRRPRHRPPLATLGAIGLLLISPPLLRELARGITPPTGGVPPALWLGWQLTIALACAVPVILAAALLRGAPQTGHRGPAFIGILLALLAATVGVFVWQPGLGWAPWYTFLWLPALVLVTRPSTRGATFAGIAVVAGSAAALLTWGAVAEGRLEVAQRDAIRLGADPDPLVEPLLEGAALRLLDGPAPEGEASLYIRWQGARHGLEGYPARLALWTRDGEMRAALALDSLDLPDSLVSAAAMALPESLPWRISSHLRIPGVYHLLVARLSDGRLLTVGVGPRTRLLPRDRHGTLLGPASPEEPLYRLTLSPPQSGLSADTRRLRWRREGWVVHGWRPVAMPDGVRETHAEVDLRGPVPVLVRGALIVVLDVALLGLIWLLAEALTGGVEVRMPRLRRFQRSFRTRLGLALAAFFLVPAVGFAVWGAARVGEEARRQRDSSVTQTLRDAITAAGENLTMIPGDSSGLLGRLAVRFGTELAVYRGGSRVAVSDSLLAALGLLEPLQDAGTFRAIAFDGESEAARDAPLPGLGGRIGFRLANSGAPQELLVVAAPLRLEPSRAVARQDDLGYLLLLAALIGLTAAFLAAGRAAKALARPVADLRRAALALGQGAPAPARSGPPPTEFEPVMGAFERMAADVRRSQAALEESRRRTATVLATVATGVVALDPEGHVLIANPRAIELLEHPLPDGARFDATLAGAWPALADAANEFLRAPEHAPAVRELDGGVRRLSVQLAPLGPELGGVVLALNDITDVARGVCAGVEMARPWRTRSRIRSPRSGWASSTCCRLIGAARQLPAALDATSSGFSGRSRD